MEDMEAGTVVAIAGLALGVVFGATAQRTNFCTMGAISDAVLMGEWNRFRAWLLAIAIAILGSQALHLVGLVDINRAIYLTPNLGWLGSIVGGVLFGFGMTKSGGCGNKTLVRLGAGNLKSLVVALVLAVFAYMTLRGLIGLARVEMEGATNLALDDMGLEAQGIPDLLAALGLSPDIARIVAIVAIALPLLWFCLKDAEFRASGADMAAGIVIGLLIPAAWAATGILGADDFEPQPLASFSFVAPVGESLIYLMTFSGATINFGIAVVGGVILGAFLAAKATGTFKFESFTDSGDMIGHLVGGAMMGVGGVLALGCTIGQGITGMSTLAIGSLIALASILFGGVWGLKTLEEGSVGGGLKAMLSRD